MFGHLLFAGSQPAQKTWCWEKVSKTTADVEREKFAGNSHWFTIQWRCGFLEPTFHRVWHINIVWNSILQHLLWSSYDSSISKTVLSRKKVSSSILSHHANNQLCLFSICISQYLRFYNILLIWFRFITDKINITPTPRRVSTDNRNEFTLLDFQETLLPRDVSYTVKTSSDHSDLHKNIQRRERIVQDTATKCTQLFQDLSLQLKMD